MKHTKEPWEANDEFIDSENGYAIARCHWDNGDQGEIDAQRIVACVNACRGITTEALAKGYIRILEAQVANLREHVEFLISGEEPI